MSRQQLPSGARSHTCPALSQAVLPVLRNPQLRKNVAHAIDVIQTKRARLVAEKTDWQELRTAASAIRTHALENLGIYLEEFENAAPPPEARFTGPPTRRRRGRSFWTFSGRRMPAK